MTYPRLKAVAAAITLSISGLASAAPIGADGLFFSASNGSLAAPSSIVINLLETTVDFRASSTVNRALSGDSLDTLTQWLTLQTDLSTLRWNVAGASIGDASSDPPSPLHGGLTTSSDPKANPAETSGSVTGLDQAVLNFADFTGNRVNGNLASTNAFFAANQTQFFSPRFDGGVDMETLGALGQSLPFIAFFADQGGNPFFEGDSTQFEGTWTLDFDGGIASLAYIAPTAIPLPGAVWLLGSAMVGIAGIARRRAA